MNEVIGQRELRNDNASIMRRVEAGERFTITRNGMPIADLVPHQRDEHPSEPRTPPEPRTLRQLQAEFRGMTPIDRARWRRERDEHDLVFGADDPLEDPWAPRGARNPTG